MDFITHQKLVKEAAMNSRISCLIKMTPALFVVALSPLLAACDERAVSAPATLERPARRAQPARRACPDCERVSGRSMS